MSRLRILRAGPMVTVQDRPRSGVRQFGLAAAGPVDADSYTAAGSLIGAGEGGGLEIGPGGITLGYDGTVPLRVGCAGGQFGPSHNGNAVPWPGTMTLAPGDTLAVGAARAGNWGYLRFSAPLMVPEVLGSRSTHLAVGLGGLNGRCLVEGDALELGESVDGVPAMPLPAVAKSETVFAVTWGFHAALLSRSAFIAAEFVVTAQMDRMGIRLADPDAVFAGLDLRGLVSGPVVPGDIQILGDRTPIVLSCEAQTTGGYPRVATLRSADVGRFAQLRPGTRVRFVPWHLPGDR